MDSAFLAKLETINDPTDRLMAKMDELIRLVKLQQGIQDLDKEIEPIPKEDTESERTDDTEFVIPSFSGKDLNLWIVDMEVVMQKLEVPNSQMVNFSHVYVSGSASEWVKSNINSICWMDWHEFVQALRTEFNKSDTVEVQDLAEQQGLESVEDNSEFEDEIVLNLEEENTKMPAYALTGPYDLSIGDGIHTSNISSLSKVGVDFSMLKYGHRGHAREVFDEMADKVGCCSFKVCARMLRYGKLGHPQQVFDQMLASTACYTLQNMNGVVDYWCVFLNSLLINYGKMGLARNVFGTLAEELYSLENIDAEAKRLHKERFKYSSLKGSDIAVGDLTMKECATSRDWTGLRVFLEGGFLLEFKAKTEDKMNFKDIIYQLLRVSGYSQFCVIRLLANLTSHIQCIAVVELYADIEFAGVQGSVFRILVTKSAAVREVLHQHAQFDDGIIRVVVTTSQSGVIAYRTCIGSQKNWCAPSLVEIFQNPSHTLTNTPHKDFCAIFGPTQEVRDAGWDPCKCKKKFVDRDQYMNVLLLYGKDMIWVSLQISPWDVFALPIQWSVFEGLSYPSEVTLVVHEFNYIELIDVISLRMIVGSYYALQKREYHIVLILTKVVRFWGILMLVVSWLCEDSRILCQTAWDLSAAVLHCQGLVIVLQCGDIIVDVPRQCYDPGKPIFNRKYLRLQVQIMVIQNRAIVIISLPYYEMPIRDDICHIWAVYWCWDDGLSCDSVSHSSFYHTTVWIFQSRVISKAHYSPCASWHVFFFYVDNDSDTNERTAGILSRVQSLIYQKGGLLIAFGNYMGVITLTHTIKMRQLRFNIMLDVAHLQVAINSLSIVTVVSGQNVSFQGLLKVSILLTIFKSMMLLLALAAISIWCIASGYLHLLEKYKPLEIQGDIAMDWRLGLQVQVLSHKHFQDYCVRAEDNAVSPRFYRCTILGAVQMFYGRAVEHMCIINWDPGVWLEKLGQANMLTSHHLQWSLGDMDYMVTRSSVGTQGSSQEVSRRIKVMPLKIIISALIMLTAEDQSARLSELVQYMIWKLNICRQPYSTGSSSDLSSIMIVGTTQEVTDTRWDLWEYWSKFVGEIYGAALSSYCFLFLNSSTTKKAMDYILYTFLKGNDLVQSSSLDKTDGLLQLVIGPKVVVMVSNSRRVISGQSMKAMLLSKWGWNCALVVFKGGTNNLKSVYTSSTNCSRVYPLLALRDMIVIILHCALLILVLVLGMACVLSTDLSVYDGSPESSSEGYYIAYTLKYLSLNVVRIRNDNCFLLLSYRKDTNLTDTIEQTVLIFDPGKMIIESLLSYEDGISYGDVPQTLIFKRSGFDISSSHAKVESLGMGLFSKSMRTIQTCVRAFIHRRELCIFLLYAYTISSSGVMEYLDLRKVMAPSQTLQTSDCQAWETQKSKPMQIRGPRMLHGKVGLIAT